MHPKTRQRFFSPRNQLRKANGSPLWCCNAFQVMNVLRADARSASQADRQKRQTSSLFRAFKFRSRNCWQPKLAADVAVPPTHTLGLPEIAAVCETQPADIFALTKLEPAWVWNKVRLEALFQQPQFAVLIYGLQCICHAKQVQDGERKD